MGGAMAWRVEKGIWVSGSPAQLLEDPGPVTALVGGGGKTSLMEHLAEAARSRGLRSAAMTTTRIWQPEEYCATREECLACWSAGRYALCGRKAPQQGKLMAPEEGLYRWLLDKSDRLYVEADGSRNLPCKAPADHEPVLPEACVCVVGVAGLSALDRPVEEVCFRPELVCRLLGCHGDHRLTEEDMARLLLSEQGGRKNVGNRVYWVVLNQCDNEERLARGKAVAAALERGGHTRTVLTRLK